MENQNLDLGVLPILKQLLETGTSIQKADASSTLWRLSALNAENQALLAAPEVGLIAPMVDILDTETGDAVDNTLSILSNIAVAPENKAMLASSNGLLKALVRIIREGDTPIDRLMNACGIFLRLSVAAEARISLANEPGLLSALVYVLKSHKAVWTKVLGTIWNLAVSPENLSLLAAVDLGLLSCLVHILQTDEGESRISCCGIFLHISRSPEYRRPLASVSLGLITALVQLIKTTQGPSRDHACGIINNVCLSSDILSKELASMLDELISALTVVLQADNASNEARGNCVGALLSMSVAVDNQRLMGTNRVLLQVCSKLD